ncbi:MAG TPA: hypothetical protein VHB21_06170, partial [Minicystis sp.]|nr:hypothetical protein [Minicystis sp.]
YVDLLRGGGGLDGAVARVVEETRAEFLDRLTSGFERAGSARGALPARTRIALRGWLGMVEGASVEWIARGGATRAEVRDLLVTALLDLLRSATE